MKSTSNAQWVPMLDLVDTSSRYHYFISPSIKHIYLILFLQAHVDTTATIVERAPDGDSVRLLFQLPEPTLSRPSVLPYIISKGYVTIDGASLTVTVVDDNQRMFGVMLIRHTQEKISLSRKKIGSKVNIEVDMVGKYVKKSVLAALEGGGGQGMKALVEKVVEDVLAKKGIK